MPRTIGKAFQFYVFALAALAVTPAMASTGQSLPWDAPLQILAANITGPVAYSITLMAAVIAAFIFFGPGQGGSETGRTVVKWIFGGALACLAVQFMTSFGFTGSVI